MARPALLRVILTLGVLSTLAAVWIIGKATLAFLAAAPSPRPSTVGVARPREWVRLDDAILRCETRAVRSGATLFVATAGDGTQPFVVQLLGDVPCEGARVEGAFAAEPLARADFERRTGMSLPRDLAEVRLFSEGYAPPYQKTIALRMLPLLGLGLVLVAIGIRGGRRRA